MSITQSKKAHNAVSKTEMTVEELIHHLSSFDPSATVAIKVRNASEFAWNTYITFAKTIEETDDGEEQFVVIGY